ncbi:hypothetical protein SPRG_11936 [Saprolegnia parasitica CBS 223.65]|uniref:FYVE-type domain-containing protein n=1 Tax=Saprolegnia parasitica (strain CBS 223.65) TaxID=695850 RepID=A0A067C8G1_SAPPC|nr:hypothetical protein SPRG_11936 [Saprolegnia parasitica CBS 223.65]KDO23092.1 hypothetical protein SPRG_11936 [Saprolegnia parasitica CBS 223.65]|eukprot:XP_012206203.1 hypothetical protein SPRG_11936 [Saprolegnia parasitica CBS 223.65]
MIPPLQFESYKVRPDRRGSDPGPVAPATWQLPFSRVSPQALGMDSVRLCAKSEWAPKGKDVRCACCDKKLILFGKHNCRVCGDLVCGRCSVKRIKTSSLKSIRTCDKCVQHNLMQFNRRRQHQQHAATEAAPVVSRPIVAPRPRAMTTHEVMRPSPVSTLRHASARTMSVHAADAPALPRLASVRSMPRAASSRAIPTRPPSEATGLSWQSKVLFLYGLVLCGVIVFEAPLDVTLLLFAMLALAFGCMARIEYASSTKQVDRILG